MTPNLFSEEDIFLASKFGLERFFGFVILKPKNTPRLKKGLAQRIDVLSDELRSVGSIPCCIIERIPLHILVQRLRGEGAVAELSNALPSKS